ncbi:monodehydroascorbate reductase, chloroplastic/mitochondrial, partial [Tanacetum coccineum]
MASLSSISSLMSNKLSFHHGSTKSFRRRNFVVSASSGSFDNENREFVIVGGGNAAGYAARTFVENGMADGKLCIVSKE